MKFKIKYRLIVTIILACLFTLVAMSTGYAESIYKSIEVNFYSVKKIVINKEDRTPPAGQQPFVYNGTTYVPLRYISESLGKSVRWDAKTGTIYINDLEERIYDNGLNIVDNFTGSLENYWDLQNKTGNWLVDKQDAEIYTNDQTAYLPLKMKNNLPDKFTVECSVAIKRDIGRAGIYISEEKGKQPTRIFISSNGVSSEYNDMYESYAKSIIEEKFYDLKISVDNHDIEVYLDGKRAFSLEAPPWYDLNYLGLYSAFDGVIKNFKITTEE